MRIEIVTQSLRIKDICAPGASARFVESKLPELLKAEYNAFYDAAVFLAGELVYALKPDMYITYREKQRHKGEIIVSAYNVVEVSTALFNSESNEKTISIGSQSDIVDRYLLTRERQIIRSNLVDYRKVN